MIKNFLFLLIVFVSSSTGSSFADESALLTIKIVNRGPAVYSIQRNSESLYSITYSSAYSAPRRKQLDARRIASLFDELVIPVVNALAGGGGKPAAKTPCERMADVKWSIPANISKTLKQNSIGSSSVCLDNQEGSGVRSLIEALDQQTIYAGKGSL